MIVLDASIVVELIGGGRLAEIIARHLAGSDEGWIAPQLLDVEVLNAFRRLATARKVDAGGSARVLTELDRLPATRYPHAPLLERIWELRANFTAYDATYIALAEKTGSTLYTCDSKLRRGHRAKVVAFE